MMRWLAPTKLMPTARSEESKQTRGNAASLLNLRRGRTRVLSNAVQWECSAPHLGSHAPVNESLARFQVNLTFECEHRARSGLRRRLDVLTDAAEHIQPISHNYHLVYGAEEDGVQQPSASLQLARPSCMGVVGMRGTV